MTCWNMGLSRNNLESPTKEKDDGGAREAWLLFEKRLQGTGHPLSAWFGENWLPQGFRLGLRSRRAEL